jgi:type VI secretion system protein ImpA
LDKETRLEIAQLLAPIEGENPVGIYLKDDRARFRQARNAFNAAQSAYRRLLETPESAQDETLIKENETNWNALEETCYEILTTQSKDVEILCWWIASQAFSASPLQSLAQSLDALLQLFNTYWPNIHPYTPDDKLKGDSDDAKTADRVAIQLRPLIQLMGESEASGLLYMPLQLIPLVSDITNAEYATARKNNALADLKQKAQKSFSSEKAEIEANIKSMGAALDTLGELEKFIGQQCQTYKTPAISCRFLKNAFNSGLEAIRYLVGEQFSRWPLDPETGAQQTTKETAKASGTETTTDNPTASAAPAQSGKLTFSGAIPNRDYAFQQMRQIAEFFKRNEPHSPISFMIEKTIRWGYLSFPELIQELVKGNQDVLQRIGVLTGMNEDGTTTIPEQVAAVAVPVETKAVEAPAEPVAAETEESSTQATTNSSSKDESGGNSSTSLTSDFQW